MKSLIRILLLVVLLVSMVTMTTFAQADRIVLLQGQVLDSEGNPIEGAVVEIWQADINGHYNHPRDASSSALLGTFQYFGTATADADGYYAFRTVKPAAYATRPPHIHVKVKLNGQTVLTTQFYFGEDQAAVAADRVASNADATLFLQTEDMIIACEAIRIATGNLVLDLNDSDADTLAVTAAQTEGPYYPVVDFSGYDNDLTSKAENDSPVTPVLAELFTSPNLLSTPAVLDSERPEVDCAVPGHSG